MKKWIVISLLIIVGFAAAPSSAYAGNIQSGDSIVDKASDWLATIGKSPEDRDMILAQRRSERAAEHLKEAMKTESKKAGKQMEKMGKDMGKMFENN